MQIAREVKRLVHPATASYLVDWFREEAYISANIEGTKIQLYSFPGSISGSSCHELSATFAYGARRPPDYLPLNHYSSRYEGSIRYTG